jgi:15-cis-phytoene synthase
VNGAGDLVTDLPDAWPTLKKHGKTFAWAAHLMPRRDANRLARLYAICRTLDDLADIDGGAEARARLLALRSAPWRFSSADPVARELAATVADTNLNPVPMQQLLDGLINDLDHQIIADEADLIGYAYLVAGTVGLMVCDVLDVEAQTARKAAINLGIAMQLTNIARDVHEDAVAGRRYVPATLWDAAPEDIAHPSPDMQRKGAQAVLRLLDLADGYYASAQCGFAFLPLSSRIGLAVAARVYCGIGAELRRRGGSFHQGRVYVPRWRKAILTVLAVGGLASPKKSIADLNLHPVILDLLPPPSKAAINGRS